MVTFGGRPPEASMASMHSYDIGAAWSGPQSLAKPESVLDVANEAGAPPRKALRVVLRQDYPGGKPQDVSNFSREVQAEVAHVLGVPPSALQVLYVFGDGTGNVAIDLALRGSVWGQEAVAAAQLAAHVARGGSGTVMVDGIRKSAMLVGADVQLLLGTPWEDAPPATPGLNALRATSPYVGSPTAGNVRREPFSWPEQISKPQLNTETQVLLDQAQELVKNRPPRNTRLKMLEMREKQKIAVRKLEDRWWAKKQARFQRCAAFIQARWRGRRIRRLLYLYRRQRAAMRIQGYYRGYRVRSKFWWIRQRFAAITKIQAWWRSVRARLRLYGLLNCVQMFWRIVLAKLMALELKSWFIRRRRAAITIESHWRGYLARKQLKKLRMLREQKVHLALIVQASWSAYITVEALKEESRAAVKIQNLWRGYVTRLWAQQTMRDEGGRGGKDEARRAQQMLNAIGGGPIKKPLTMADIERERLEAQERRERLQKMRQEDEARLKRIEERAKQHGEEITGIRTGRQAKLDMAARLVQRVWKIKQMGRKRAGEARIRLLQKQIGAQGVAKLPPDLLDAIRKGDLAGTEWEVDEYSEYGDDELAEFTSFDKRLKSKHVVFSTDCISAKSTDETREELFGVCFCNGPLPKFKAGEYFEVRVDKVVSGGDHPDGLTLGVTTKPPMEEGRIPLVHAEVPFAWCIGGDGYAIVVGEEEWDAHFHPVDLKVGDRVGLLVTPKREVWVVLNGKFIDRTPGDGPAKGSPLYPFIDLLGNTLAASLILDAKPPEKPVPYRDEYGEIIEQSSGGWSLFGGGEEGEPEEDQQSEQGGDLGDREEPEFFQGWDKSYTSRYIEISKDGLRARHTDHTRTEMFGLVFGDNPIQSFSEGLYFEVRIDEVVHGCPDGLVVGVTTRRPRNRNDLPKGADELPDSWSLGYNGHAKVPDHEDMLPIAWDPTQLRKDDRVGLLVNLRGEVCVILNGDLVDRAPSPAPHFDDLYPFIDLLGNTVAVTLLTHAKPPGLNTCRMFDKRLVSPVVTLTPDCLTAQSWDPTGHEMHGVIYGDAPLIKFDAGHYFEVRLEKIRPGLPDGLTLGVTTKLPKPTAPPLQTADELVSSWSIGYNGAAHVDNMEDLLPVKFAPNTLEEGDRVGLLVKQEGDMCLIVNDTLRVRMAGNVPTDGVLFPVVDLLGTAQIVKLLPGAPPPELKAPKKREKAEDDSDGGGSVGSSLTDGGEVVGGPDSADAAAAPMPPPKNMTGFHAESLHDSIKLSNNGMRVQRKQDADEELFGVCLGNAPVPGIPEVGRYFAVNVDSVRKGERDGMAIGFTAVAPHFKSTLPETAEDLEQAWFAGFDGVYFNTAKGKMKEIKWSADNLKPGDDVGALADKDGDFVIVWKGKTVLYEKGVLPVDTPLYAVVNLMGNTTGVSFLPGAKPPVAAAPFESWDAKLLSKQVVLMQGGLRIQHRDKKGEAFQGVTFINGSLREYPEGEYFQVRVELLRDESLDLADGLTIGVTTERPTPPWTVPEDAHDLKKSYSFGYDGMAWVNGQFEQITWSPVDLQAGDTVGVLVSPVKEDRDPPVPKQIWLLVNGTTVAQIPPNPEDPNEEFFPEHAPLFGFVDLLGRTMAVTLQPDMGPPEGIAPSAGGFGFYDYGG